MIADSYASNDCTISFELFPPKTTEGERALFKHVEKLMQFSPSMITCTYGAGGSTQEKTLGIVRRVKEQFQVPVASHLTCVGSTVDELRQYLTAAQEAGVDSIVALRGDPPKGQDKFEAVEGGLRYASELVTLVRKEFPSFGVAVAGYPEVHQEAPSAEADLQNLKHKVECGGDIVITQLFYCNEDFESFRQRYDAAGIKAPLIPGLLPVTNLSQIKRITSLCGAKLPDNFVSRLAEREDDPKWQFEVGVEFAVQQVQELKASGVPGIHFYVLNKSEATSAVLNGIGLS